MAIGDILGGIGAGIRTGMETQRRLKAADDESQLRQYQIDAAKRDKDYRDAQAAAGQQTGDIASGIAQNAQNATAGLQGIKARAAQQPGTTVNVDTSTLSPSTAAIVNSVADAASTPSVTTDALTGGAAPGLQAAPPTPGGIRPLPVAPVTSSAIDSGAPAIDQQSQQSRATQQIFQKMAQVAAQNGRPEDVQKFSDMANSADMKNYERAWTNTMRVLESGNDQAAATAIMQLYNLGFPDGKSVDVAPLGNGQFKVVQYDDKTGQMLDGKVIDRSTMHQLGESTLNPGERVKLWVQQNHDERALQVAQEGTRRSEARDDSREKISSDREDARDARSRDHDAAMERIATGRSEALLKSVDKKNDAKPDPQAAADAKVKSKALSDLKVIGLKAKGLSEEDRTAAMAQAEQLVNDGQGASTAWDTAVSARKDKTAAVDADFNTHLTDIGKSNMILPATDSDIEKRGDPAIVKAAKAMASDGKLTRSNYEKAFKQSRMKSGTAPAAPVNNDPLGLRNK